MSISEISGISSFRFDEALSVAFDASPLDVSDGVPESLPFPQPASIPATMAAHNLSLIHI